MPSDFEYAIQTGAFAGLPRLVNIEHEVATLTGIVRNVKDSRFAGGAKGNGVTDDTTAFQLALNAAAGGTLLVPPPTSFYPISTELLYDTAALGTVRILGSGAGSIMKATGASNKVLHISGTAGVTTPFVSIENLQIQSATSGTCPAGIHLDGIASFELRHIVVQGNSKITDGIRCTASQQGEIYGGGFIRGCVSGIRLEPSGGVHPNGIEIHGMSFTVQSGAHMVLDSLDSGSIHSNHMTGAPIGIDDIAGGFGYKFVAHNHFEDHTTAGVRSVGGMHVVSNDFFASAGSTDIRYTSGDRCVIRDNFCTSNVILDAGTDHFRFRDNRLTAGTFTNNGTNIIKSGNSGTIGGATNSLVAALTYSATIATDASLADMFTITATNTSAFTISTPTNPTGGQTIIYDITNSSGGAMGAITWGAAFKLDATGFVNPANGKSKTIRFYYNGTNWKQVGSTSADI